MSAVERLRKVKAYVDTILPSDDVDKGNSFNQHISELEEVSKTLNDPPALKTELDKLRSIVAQLWEPKHGQFVQARLHNLMVDAHRQLVECYEVGLTEATRQYGVGYQAALSEGGLSFTKQETGEEYETDPTDGQAQSIGKEYEADPTDGQAQSIGKEYETDPTDGQVQSMSAEYETDPTDGQTESTSAEYEITVT